MQAILMLCVTGDKVLQRQDLHLDSMLVGSVCDVKSSRFKVAAKLAVDARAVLRADVVALSVEAVGVNDFEKQRHQPGNGLLFCIKHDTYALSVTVIGARRAMTGAIGSTRFGFNDTRQVSAVLLHTPQATTSKIEFFAHRGRAYPFGVRCVD